MTRSDKVGVGIGVVLAALGIVVAALVVVQQRFAKAAAEAQLEEGRSVKKEVDDLTAQIVAARAAQKKRLMAAEFSAIRTAAIDGQCLGKGKPKLGYVIQGSTYQDNVLVGDAMNCEPYGSRDNNITNFFCCPMPAPDHPKIEVTEAAP